MADLVSRIDTLIVGSGYGGAVMAARLAGTRRVVLIERGRRWTSRELPEDIFDFLRAYQRPGGGGKGLWGLRIGDGVGNGYASAYGGASIINYGITLRPDDHVFERWPVSAHEMAPFFERAESVLLPTANPRADGLGDKEFLDEMEPGARSDLRNTIDWQKCIECGNCILGCRHDAKRSLDRTYLAIAEARGLEVRLETTVTAIVPDDGGYRVWLRPTGRGGGFGRIDGGDGATTVWAREVVLSAGTFGTLDLLAAMRPRIPLSPLFGERMSMNGDALALLYDSALSVGGSSGAPVSTAVRTYFTDDDGRKRLLTIMSGRIPKAVMGASGIAMAALAEVLGGVRLPVIDESPMDTVQSLWRRARDLFGSSPSGALERTYLYKLDGEDQAKGRLGFDSAGRAVMDWADYGDDPLLRFAERKLKAWAVAARARPFRDLGALPGMRHFGVHPLGGATMGEGFYDGVCDGTGRVFKPGGGFHDGLRVVDGSLVRTALGVPASFTIAALAERAADAMLSGE